MNDQEKRLASRLEALGIQVSILPVKGGVFAKEIELRYSFIHISRATLDQALLAFMEELLRFVDVETPRAGEAQP